MPTPNQELADAICASLIEAGVANENEVASLKSLVLSGKVKAEDWYSAVEKSLPNSVEVPSNGN